LIAFSRIVACPLDFVLDPLSVVKAIMYEREWTHILAVAMLRLESPRLFDNEGRLLVRVLAGERKVGNEPFEPGDRR